MLVLSRRTEERIVIGDQIVLTVLSIRIPQHRSATWRVRRSP
jgi:sRNA-binding carbon storage regulator CsrA